MRIDDANPDSIERVDNNLILTFTLEIESEPEDHLAGGSVIFRQVFALDVLRRQLHDCGLALVDIAQVRAGMESLEHRAIGQMRVDNAVPPREPYSGDTFTELRFPREEKAPPIEIAPNENIEP